MRARAEIEALDRADPLAPLRERFALPQGLIYLDGNSLGALPRAAPLRMREVVERHWGQDLIASWNRHGWVDLPLRVGAKIAPLIGAHADEVVVADSISVNLFKLVAAALRLRPERRVVVAERGSFPTDLYMLQGLASLLGRRIELRLVEADEVEAACDGEVALLVHNHVDYRSGRLHDMARLTAAAHAAGALALFDLAHSAGTMAVDLEGARVDLAVGCGYKYLNGGPGAPAFVYVARRWQDEIRQPLTGWFGHRQPFAFAPDYTPAPGVRRFLAGTPPILSLAALEVGVDGFAGVDLAAVRAKAIALGDLFIELVEGGGGGLGIELASPRAAARRGAQVAFRHPQGYAIVQALIARGVVGDFRAPDLLRFGFAPLYVRFVDVLEAARALVEVMRTRAFERPEFHQQAAVT
jgi:kynureninase